MKNFQLSQKLKDGLKIFFLSLTIIATLAVTHMFIAYRSYFSSQLKTCNVMLRQFAGLEAFDYYCEWNGDGVVLKSKSARRTIYNITYDERPDYNE